MAAFRHSLRVRFNECDPQGIVFNANYLTYADIAVTELYREAFGSWEEPMAEHGVDMVVAEANVRFRAPLSFDQQVDLVVTMPKLGETSTLTRVEVVSAETVATEVELRHVFLDATTRAKTPIPAPVRDVLARYTPPPTP